MPYPTEFPKEVRIYQTAPLRIRIKVWLRRPGTLSPEDEGVRRDLIADFGSDWACHIRPEPGATKSIQCDVDTSNGADGELVISATGAQTALLTAGLPHGLDIRATNDDGENSFIGRGKATVEGVYTVDD